ncbi:transporter [Sphingomonas sp. ZB1N12]|uniref:transporter n=1 Tax=Sphingomonas arabinosi TaxID=3096160 RepID=UPI002FC7ABA1
MKAVAIALVSLAALHTAGANAQEREYCPERPGIDTPACTMAKGRVSVETSIADWTRDDQPGSRDDNILFGDTLVRVGVSDTVEARVGWTPFGHDRMRDQTGIDTVNGVGDVSLGMKANLRDPDGSGLSIAVLPYVTLPVGRSGIGAGDWGTGLLVPVTYELSDTLSLDLTPEIDAAVDEDGNGRHLAYSTAAGLSVKLDKAFTLTGEFQALRDDDPEEHATQALAALSLAWSANDDLQFDVFGAAGLNHHTPDARLYAGVSRRF